MSRAIRLHGKIDHRANGPDPIPVLVHLKVFSDATAAATGDNAKRFVVTDDLGAAYIRSIHATVTEPGSGDTVIQVHNLTTGDDLLSTPITIEAGDTNSYDSPAQPVVDDTVNLVIRGDVLRVDVTTGSDALGLEVLPEFGPDIIRVS